MIRADLRAPSSWYFRMQMHANDMVCSCESLWRAQSLTGSSWRSATISLLMRLRRWRDAPFVDLCRHVNQQELSWYKFYICIDTLQHDICKVLPAANAATCRAYKIFYERKQLLSHRNSVCLSVRPSVTRVDQSKTAQARITKSSPSGAWKTLVSETVKLFHKFEGVTPNEGAKWEGVGKICDFLANKSLYLSNGAR